MSEYEAVKNDRRRVRRQHRLGTDAACVICGERNPAALTTGAKGLIEDHHIAAIANDPELTVALCLNCHRKVTGRMEENGTPLSRPRSLLDALVAKLGGREAFFAELAASDGKESQRVRALIARLDRHLPNWRKLLGDE